MCREFGGFDPTVLNPPPPRQLHSTPTGAPSRTAPPSRSWPATARAVRPAHVAVVPIQPPPQYVLALAWRRGARCGSSPVPQLP
jgi:hypothetical protein